MIERAANFLTRHRHLNWALADQIIVSGANFLTALLVARHLGPEEFGRFTLAWLVVLFTTSLQAGLIVSPMISVGPKLGAAETPAYFGTVCLHQAVFAAVTFGLLLVFGLALDGVVPRWHAGELVLPTAVAALAHQSQDFLRRYFYTRNRGGAAFVNDAISYIGRIALLVVFFQVTAFDGAGALWVVGASSGLGVAVGVFGVERLRFRMASIVTVTRRQWKSGRWLTFSALLQWTTGNLFLVAAGALLGTSAVGGLRAAYTIIGVLHVLYFALENVVPIRAGRYLREGGTQALRTYLRRIAWGVGLVTAFVGLSASAAPEFWLGFVFGEAFAPYGYLLPWYAVIYLFIGLGLPLRFGLRAMERTRPIFNAFLAATVFTVIAVYPMIMWLEMSGVMAGMLIIQCLQQLVLFHGLSRSLRKAPFT